MIDKQDALWGMVGVVSLTVFLIAVWHIFTAPPIPWTGLLIVVIVGGIAGAIPRLPQNIMAKYRMLWFSLGLVACIVLFFWPGIDPLQIIGGSTLWLVGAIGHFWCKWRSRNVPRKSETTSGDSKNDKP